MQSSIMQTLLIMVSFLLIAGPTNARLLMKNKQFLLPHNPSGFGANLDSLVKDGSRLHTADVHVEKDAVQSDQERIPRSSSSVNSATNNKLSFRRSLTVQNTEKFKAEGVFNLEPKDKVTPSRSSPSVNSMVSKHELSTSKAHSPGVGHMQMIRPKSQTISVHIIKSVQTHGDDHVQQETSNKRKLGSTPSPGCGN